MLPYPLHLLNVLQKESVSIVPGQKHIFNDILHSFLLELEGFSPDYRGVDQVQSSTTTITVLNFYISPIF